MSTDYRHERITNARLAYQFASDSILTDENEINTKKIIYRQLSTSIKTLTDVKMGDILFKQIARQHKAQKTLLNAAMINQAWVDDGSITAHAEKITITIDRAIKSTDQPQKNLATPVAPILLNLPPRNSLRIVLPQILYINPPNQKPLINTFTKIQQNPTVPTFINPKPPAKENGQVISSASIFYLKHPKFIKYVPLTERVIHDKKIQLSFKRFFSAKSSTLPMAIESEKITPPQPSETNSLKRRFSHVKNSPSTPMPSILTLTPTHTKTKSMHEANIYTPYTAQTFQNSLRKSQPGSPSKS